MSIVIPALDEECALPLLLEDLRALRARGVEVVVADGGSRDRTLALAREGADRVVECARGRASQMNAGAAAASGDMLVFLHADTRLPRAAAHAIAGLAHGAPDWGYFRVRLAGVSGWLPLIGRMMWWRSRLTGIATGDQGLFVRRSLFEEAGGFPAQPLMEDIEMCRRLGAISAGSALDVEITGSGRRWDRDGALRTIVTMWWLRLRYFRGADPRDLHRSYYGE